MNTRFLFASVATILLAGGALAYRATADKHERTDCPGTVICPLTGEETCKDECPLIDPNLPDCPGKIVCPLTGELICKDQCPVGGQGAECCERSCCDGTAAAND